MVYDDGFDVRCGDAEVRVFHHMLLPGVDTYPNISLASTATEPAMTRFLAAASALAQQLEPFQGFATATAAATAVPTAAATAAATAVPAAMADEVATRVATNLRSRRTAVAKQMEVDRILRALNMLATVNHIKDAIEDFSSSKHAAIAVHFILDAETGKQNSPRPRRNGEGNGAITVR